jgi:hypothetical protein
MVGRRAEAAASRCARRNVGGEAKTDSACTGGSAVMFVAHLGIAMLVYQFQASWAQHPGAAWASVACVPLPLAPPSSVSNADTRAG